MTSLDEVRQPAPPAVLRLDGERSQAAFRTLLDACSRPGEIVELDPRVLPEGVPPGLVVPLALADVDVRVEVVGEGAGHWVELLAVATGARRGPLEAAEILVHLGPGGEHTIRRARRGRPEAPEEAARLALGCRELRSDPSTAQVVLELSGPGIPGQRYVGLDGIRPAVIAARNEVCEAFPAGVDTWIVDDHHRVLGLPRSTRARMVRPTLDAGWT